MGRPPLPVGTPGKITTTADPGGGYRARASFRDYDGTRREVSRWARSRSLAETALKVALTDRAAAGKSGEITPDTRFKKLAELWLVDVDAGRLAPNSKAAYRGATNLHLIPPLSGLRLREVDVLAVNRVLRSVQTEHGAGSAKTARTVLSSILASAVQVGAMPANPVRDARRIEQPRKAKPRALTHDEANDLVDKLRTDDRAIAFDIPDVADWMLGTGMRIGEACCVRAGVLDDDAQTVEVNATMVRIKRQGLHIQQWTKTDPGWRVLALPPYLGGMLERRRTEAFRIRGPQDVVFASPRGHLLDGSNTARALREALDRTGFKWVTSHTFRKSVATWMDEAGCTPREVADQLGHARPSMTQDVYFGRNVVSAAAAAILER